jgi:hypothetical protein
MRKLMVIPIALVALVFAAAPSVSAAPPIPASGTFEAVIVFETLKLEPRGNNCLLEVEGSLEFEGTLEGTASGHTTALVFAPCEEVADNPPGTFRDVFKSNLHFTGTVDGKPATAHMVFQGQVEEGGAARSIMRLSDGVRGVLKAEGVVALEGEYEGRVKVE